MGWNSSPGGEGSLTNLRPFTSYGRQTLAEMDHAGTDVERAEAA
jgi:hypothetical protein